MLRKDRWLKRNASVFQHAFQQSIQYATELTSVSKRSASRGKRSLTSAPYPLCSFVAEKEGGGNPRSLISFRRSVQTIDGSSNSFGGETSLPRQPISQTTCAAGPTSANIPSGVPRCLPTGQSKRTGRCSVDREAARKTCDATAAAPVSCPRTTIRSLCSVVGDAKLPPLSAEIPLVVEKFQLDQNALLAKCFRFGDRDPSRWTLPCKHLPRQSATPHK